MKIGNIQTIEEIPFLPISFFKTHRVQTLLPGTQETQKVFESSGTTGEQSSKHYVNDISLYEESFLTAFEMFYGAPSQYLILGLLPGYLERQNSSLVYMVQGLMDKSGHEKAGFFLYNHAQLFDLLQQANAVGQKVLLIGVTFSLLDFAEKYTMNMRHTIVMETGGMKGRKAELTRDEVHAFLQERLGVETIHTEYSMTELLSQAYSSAGGKLVCPPWMKVVMREQNDPFALTARPRTKVGGLINVIDLANIYSCAFIATDDVGRLYYDGSFEVLGRSDQSDLRGCSLLVV